MAVISWIVNDRYLLSQSALKWSSEGEQRRAQWSTLKLNLIKHQIFSVELHPFYFSLDNRQTDSVMQGLLTNKSIKITFVTFEWWRSTLKLQSSRFAYPQTAIVGLTTLNYATVMLWYAVDPRPWMNTFTSLNDSHANSAILLPVTLWIVQTARKSNYWRKFMYFGPKFALRAHKRRSPSRQSHHSFKVSCNKYSSATIDTWFVFKRSFSQWTQSLW